MEQITTNAIIPTSVLIDLAEKASKYTAMYENALKEINEATKRNEELAEALKEALDREVEQKDMDEFRKREILRYETYIAADEKRLSEYNEAFPHFSISR